MHHCTRLLPRLHIEVKRAEGSCAEVNGPELMMTSWFSRLRRQARRNPPAQLIGCWELVRADASDADVGVEIEFKTDGQMQYSIPMPDRWQIIKLTWWVEANSIVTDQPSAPRVERTEFSFDGDMLVLKRPESGRSWFRRSQKHASDVQAQGELT